MVLAKSIFIVNLQLDKKLIMRKFNFLILSFVLLTVVACSNQEESSREEQTDKHSFSIHWLNGKWVNEENDGTLIEEWEMKNDSTWIGKSLFVEGEDTLFTEYLRISSFGDSILYESLGDDLLMPKVKEFKGLATSEKQLSFENLSHAFPRTIRYNYLSDTSMMIEIAGVVDGMNETQPYLMIKAK